MGLSHMGPIRPHTPGLERLGQKRKVAWYPYATPVDLDDGNAMGSAMTFGTVYRGSLDPFYAGTQAYWNDPTLKFQAPRPSTGDPNNPSSHAWFDQTLTYQAQRGGLYGHGLNAATEMSTTTKAIVGIGVGMALIGAGLLVLR